MKIFKKEYEGQWVVDYEKNFIDKFENQVNELLCDMKRYVGKGNLKAWLGREYDRLESGGFMRSINEIKREEKQYRRGLVLVALRELRDKEEEL